MEHAYRHRGFAEAQASYVVPRYRDGYSAFPSAPLRRIETVREGLPVADIDDLLTSGRLTAVELDQLVLPRKTLAHRRTMGRLSPEQSDRLLRIVRILDAADETFQSSGKAAIWLRRPTAPLGGHAPLDLLDTDIGTREVERLLDRVAHGIAA